MSTVKSHVEGTTLIMERLFKAPRQLVFEAFSTPAHLEKWWGRLDGRRKYTASTSNRGDLALLHDLCR